MTHLSIDGVAVRPTRPATAGVSPPVARQAVNHRAPTKPTRQKNPSKNWKERLQMPLIIAGGMSAGFAIQNAVLGQILIVVFGVVSIIYRIPSRVSFWLALAALLATTGLLVLGGNVVLSQTFAVYTFLFLVVGVFTLNRELKREGGRIYSRRPRI